MSKQVTDKSLTLIMWGLMLSVVVILFAVSCNPPSDDGGYYPHDHTHGYYDTHHHYHYYHQYGNGRRVSPRPAPNSRPKAPSFRSGTSKSRGRR